MSLTEEITWHAVADKMPDDDETVLIVLADGDVCSGWHDGDNGWRDIGAFQCATVTHWATMPKGPAP